MTREPSITPGDPGEPHYPQATAHTWGAFAGLAIELGGYGDLEVVDPYNGDRLWIPDAFGGPSANEMANALRRLADIIDEGRFVTDLRHLGNMNAPDDPADLREGPLHSLGARMDVLFTRLGKDAEIVHHDPQQFIWGLEYRGVGFSATLNITQ